MVDKTQSNFKPIEFRQQEKKTSLSDQQICILVNMATSVGKEFQLFYLNFCSFVWVNTQSRHPLARYLASWLAKPLEKNPWTSAINSLSKVKRDVAHKVSTWGRFNRSASQFISQSLRWAQKVKDVQREAPTGQHDGTREPQTLQWHVKTSFCRLHIGKN